MASAPEQPASSPPSWWQRTCRVGWKAVRYFWATFLLTLVLPKGVEVLFSDKPLRSLPNLWPILEAIIHHPIWTLLTFLGLLLLTGLFWFGSRERPGSSSLSPDQQSRVYILKALRKAYTDELAASLQSLTRIPLQLHERFDLTHPARLVTWPPGQQERVLPAETTIVDAYDQAGNGLLILGEPGAGKSTLLYDLAQTLLSRAKQNEQDGLPIILNLSSWATERLPLEEWIVGELQRRYGIPRPFGRGWEQQAKLLLLLDGLDEVAVSARDGCIEAINTYHSKRFVPLVVCSRREEYQAASKRLRLQSAVIVRPLSSEQVKDYLADAGEALAAVQMAINTNLVLQELLTTPLMLSVVTLTYRDKAVKDLPHLGSAEEQQQQVFAHYITRMLDQRTRKWHYTSSQTWKWLTWLAQHMKQRNRTEFYLESLQSSWLSTERAQAICERLDRLVMGFVGGLIGGLIGGMIVGLIFGLTFGLAFGLTFWLCCIGFMAFLQVGEEGEIIPVEWRSWSWKGAQEGCSDDLCGCVISYGLIFELPVGLIGGLLGGLARGPLIGLVSGPVDLVMTVLLVGLFLWTDKAFSGSPANQDFTAVQEIADPSQSIRNSVWNALRRGLIALLISELPVMLIYGLIYGLVFRIFSVQIFMLFSLQFIIQIFLLISISLYGEAYLRHYVLRYLLWRSRAIPWHYVRFLEEARERILLQRVGSGYRFIHPLFLDYLASQATTASPGVTQQSSPLS
jgi:predicted lipid-binding transport protein (Tim44 family)